MRRNRVYRSVWQISAEWESDMDYYGLTDWQERVHYIKRMGEYHRRLMREREHNA